MSESPAPDPATPDPIINVVPPVQGDPADLGEPGKKALATERSRADTAEKAAKALQAKLDEIELAKLSDLEKAQKITSDLTARLAEYETRDVRQKVALDKHVPAHLVDRLRGSTEQELSADADALMALVNAPKIPIPDPSQGARGSLSSAGDSGMRELARSLFQSTV